MFRSIDFYNFASYLKRYYILKNKIKIKAKTTIKKIKTMKISFN